MIWFALWTALVLAAAGEFFLLGRSLWRKSKALTRELGEATDRLTEISDRLASLNDSADMPADVGWQSSSPSQRR